MTPPPTVTGPVQAAIQQIEIEDGEIEDDIDRVRSPDGRILLHIRSDVLVLVELDGSNLKWLIPAGGQALVEFTAPSTKGAKLDLRHRRGILVLRVRN